MIRHVCALVLTLLLLLMKTSSSGEALPLKLPQVVWDIDFNRCPEGVIPPGMTKEEQEAFLTPNAPGRLPIRTYSWLGYVTDTRRATVEKEAHGLRDSPLVFVFEENEQPTYGPMFSFLVPSDLAKAGARWRLELDTSRNMVGISGGIHLSGVAGCEFFEDGLLKNRKVGLGRYAGNSPIHLTFLIDARDQTVRITMRCKETLKAQELLFPWSDLRVKRFNELRLHGLLPGGHAEAPASIAFDNIKLTLEEIFPATEKK